MPSACDARARAAGICEPQACHSDRDRAHGYTAPKGQVRVVPSESMAMPSASWLSAVRAASLAAGLDVRGEAEHGLRAGVGAVGDQPRGVGRPSTETSWPYVSSTCRSTASMESSSRSRRNPANASSAGSPVAANAAYPSPSAQMVRATQ